MARAAHLLLAAAPQLAAACTVFAAGRKATADGSVIVSHSDDGEPNNDARLLYVPAADYPEGSRRPVYAAPESFPRYVGSSLGPEYEPNADTGPKVFEPIGYIDQVPHTYGYQDSTYGILNEHGVAIAESTCSAAFGTCQAGSTTGCEPGRKVGTAMMSIDTLSQLAMERATSSRQAVEIMGRYASNYGFYGPGTFEGTGESVIVGDPKEAWAFQICPDDTGASAIWAAQRVPDDGFTVVANMFTIRTVNASDTENFLLSENLFRVALQKGWWKPGSPLDFTLTYSAGEYAHKYYSGRRMWGAFRRAAPSVSLPDEYEDIRYKPVYPWSVKPDKPVTHRDFMDWHRDWYAGTKYDMTKGLQAGPFGSPDRFNTMTSVPGNWERSITLYRTNAVYVQHLQEVSETRPKGTASVAWFGAGPAHYTTFLPIPNGVTATMQPLRFATPKKFQPESMNWATRKVLDVCQVHFARMHPVVEAAQKETEDEGDRLVAWARANATGAGELSKAFEAHAEKALSAWRQLAADLLFRYSDNTDIEKMAPLGYPDAWLKGVGFQEGPPPAPPQDQCPPKCGGPGSIVV